MAFQENNNSSSDDLFNSIFNSLSGILEAFNEISILIFNFGNIILFLIFILMGMNLLLAAKENENKEMIHGNNLEYIKRRGRASSLIFIFVAIGFLFKGLIILIFIGFNSLYTPPIFSWLKCEYLFNKISNLKDLKKFDLFEVSLFLFISLMSFFSIIIVSLGVYLILFNKTILHTKYKPFSILFLGIILGIIFGFSPGLLLTL